MKRRAFFLFLIFFSYNVRSESQIPNLYDLSLDEKIGQLIIMATTSSIERNVEFIKNSPYILDEKHAEAIIREYNVGGVIFLGASSPEEQVAKTRKLQAITKHPLLIGLDAEWGLAMRHKRGVITFPRAMTLGALSPEDNYLIYMLGMEIGRQCKQLGTHINFAPVVDVNNNPKNPIINTRSFGENPQIVADKASLFIKGMQDAGIFACAKHFPGHGDTDIDSHSMRGIIAHDAQRLRQVELVPFQQAIKDNVDAIMTAHLDVPSLSPDEKVPATLSRTIITDLLRKELKFDGLVITDGLGMKGVTNDFEPGELELKALKAGNDILLCPVDIPCAIARIKKAITDGEFSEQDLDMHVQRILNAKIKIMKNFHEQLDTASLITSSAQSLKEQLYRAAVTVAKTEKPDTLPLTKSNRIVVKTFGKVDKFIQTLKKSISFDHYPSELNDLQDGIDNSGFEKADQIVVSLHLEGRSGMIEMQKNAIDLALPAYISFIKKYAKKTILVIFGNPYNCSHFSDVPTIIVGYENEPEAQKAVAEVLLGFRTAKGVLPVTP